MSIDDLFAAILDNREAIEDTGEYGDLLFRVRDGKVDLHITKMVRCAGATCEELDTEGGLT